MNDDIGQIENHELILGECVKLSISLKSLTGKLFIDVRKWFKYPNLDHYVSSKKGVMIELETWKQALPIIHKMIDDNSK